MTSPATRTATYSPRIPPPMRDIAAELGRLLGFSRLYHEARNDLQLSGFPFTLYCYLMHEVLHEEEWRPVKHEAVAVQWGVSTKSIQRTLHKLVQLGYLYQGDARPGEMRLYKLVKERMP